MALLRSPPLQFRLLTQRLFYSSAIRSRSQSVVFLHRPRIFFRNHRMGLVGVRPRYGVGVRAFMSSTFTSEALQEKPGSQQYGSDQIQVILMLQGLVNLYNLVG